MDADAERDPVAAELIALLRSAGADAAPHGGTRTLLEHLAGTYEIVARWGQPAHLQHAALLHSVGGTEVYTAQLLGPGRRAELRAVAGEAAERLAYLFGVVPREILFAGTHRWARDPIALPDPGEAPPTRAELDELVLLHLANAAEQARAPDGSPGRWLVRARVLGELLRGSEAVHAPAFVSALAGLTEDDEALSRRAYRSGLADPARRAAELALAAASSPALGEPCLWLAHLAGAVGDLATARPWARLGHRRLIEMGVEWDKRLSFEEWLELAELLEEPAPHDAAAITDPRALLAAARGGVAAAAGAPSAGADTGRRFERYIASLADPGGPPLRGVYPDLESRPWFEPTAFAIVAQLEEHAQEIRREILALDAERFHPESERIERTGSWDVAFFYERGRRHDDVCAACPVTTRTVESDGAMRTASGLIYASRMRAGTHIAAHRGPTNLRVRCHLGITVPDGDCAIQVGDRTEHWRQDRCLVFDDFFEHEAWNRTDQDRIVLIVDLWHPGLSAREVHLLEGLHRYAYANARQLGRYWARNAAASAGAPD